MTKKTKKFVSLWYNMIKTKEVKKMKLSDKIEAFSKYKPNIQKAISKFNGSGVSKDILEAKADNILMDAFKSYDSSSGTSFETHLYNHLRGLYREVNNMQNIVKIPEHKKLSKDEKYFGIKDSFQDETDNSVMANMETGRTEDFVKNVIIKARPDLTDREKEVFDHIYGFNGKKELENKDIMNKLNLSKSRFSELKKSISNKVIPYYALKTNRKTGGEAE